MLGVHMLAVLMVVVMHVLIDSGFSKNYSQRVKASVNIPGPRAISAPARKVFVWR
jgi:hypothetical protein